jgi:DNA polymerase (family X)
MDKPYLALWSRTTGRLIGEREGCDIDVERVLLLARERGCGIDPPALPKAMPSVPGAIS